MNLRPEHNSTSVAIVPNSFNLTDGTETPFGKRWGGDVIHLSASHLASLAAGETLTVDVQGEYVIFLKGAKPEGVQHGG